VLLLANGCSHTAGAEIEETMLDKCYEKAWPRHLADKLNCEYINLAVSGASNHRVIRTTMDFIGQRILNKQSLQDIFAVICWPGAYRTELYIEEQSGEYNNNIYGWQPLVVGNNHIYKNFRRDVYNYYKYWAMTYTYEQALTQYVMDIITLQNYFTTFQIPYLFWRASNTRLDISSTFSSYIVQVNRKRFPSAVKPKSDYTSLLEYYGCKPSPYTAYNHFGEDGHIKFSELLFEYIQEKELLNC